MTRTRYEWTTGRVVLATLLVTAFVAFAGVTFWTTFADEFTGPPPRIIEPQFDVTNMTVDAAEIIIGGPPKDGIPALVNPAVVPVATVEYLADADRLVEVSVGGEVRGYPLRILIWHEVVNDVLGSVPIAVVYCPLCDAVSVVERRLDGRTLTFGISGLILNSNLLLYDHATDALWSQVGLKAISGPDAGRALPHLGWALTTFDRFRAEQPEATVLGIDTGYERTYDRLPYAGYFEGTQLLFDVPHRDPRLPLKEPVVGVLHDGLARAYPVATLRNAPGGRLHDEIGGEPVILEAGDGPGTARVVQVPEGSQVIYTYWFAWVAFHERTEVYEE